MLKEVRLQGLVIYKDSFENATPGGVLKISDCFLAMILIPEKIGLWSITKPPKQLLSKAAFKARGSHEGFERRRAGAATVTWLSFGIEQRPIARSEPCNVTHNMHFASLSDEYIWLQPKYDQRQKCLNFLQLSRLSTKDLLFTENKLRILLLWMDLNKLWLI